MNPTSAPIRSRQVSRLKSTALTPAETIVARLLCTGLTNREIAQALGKSEPTVKHQVSAIFKKTGFRRRSAYIVAAIRHRTPADPALTPVPPMTCSG